MQRPIRSALPLAVLILSFTPALAVAQSCLHDNSESPAERDRRREALTAVRIINTTEAILKMSGRYGPLEELSLSIAPMRSDGGPMGTVARKLNFSGPELLPGWRVQLVAIEQAYAISLRDTRDPCGFGYVSDQNGVIYTSYPIQ